MINRIITLILSFLILVGIFLWTDEVMVLMIAGVVVILLIISLVCLIIVRAKLKMSIKVNNSTISGDPIKVHITACNKSILPVFFCAVKIKVYNKNFGLTVTQIKHFSLFGRTDKNITLDVSCQYCGKYLIMIEYVKIYDFFGIFSCKAIKKQKFNICMYPQHYNVKSISQVMRVNYEKEKYFNHRKGTILSELLQYREYHPGDNMKLINWKVSGKSDELMVREFDTPTDNQLLLLFDTYEGEKIYKNLVYTVLTSISLSYAQNGIAHYISWYNPIKESIENHMVERFEDVFYVIQMIFEIKSEQEYISINYLIQNNIINKYAKVIYITNHLSGGIQRELAMCDKIKTILIDANTFGEKDIKKSIGLLNV